ncbi:MAG: DUF1365 domain-containing protein [Devosia sp.]
MSLNSALYQGIVVHKRLRPRQHKLRYRVFSLLIDLDELERLNTLRWFGHNRAALFSFRDTDHGIGKGKLRDWVEERLTEAGIAVANPSIRMLCYPRILGYVFNPLTVYFCSDRTGVLRGILYEVHNTFGERRTYIIRPEGEAPIRHSADKEMYVSPFVPMDCAYHFNIVPPAGRVAIGITETDAQGVLLTASFAGKHEELTDRTLLRAFFAYPLMTLKVTAAIHWEAIKLLIKGVRYIPRKPAAARIATSVVKQPEPAE